jgi:hypothetical protein
MCIYTPLEVYNDFVAIMVIMFGFAFFYYLVYFKEQIIWSPSYEALDIITFPKLPGLSPSIFCQTGSRHIWKRTLSTHSFFNNHYFFLLLRKVIL